VTLLSTDFHTGPIADLKDVAARHARRLGADVVDLSLSQACAHLSPPTCASAAALRVLRSGDTAHSMYLSRATKLEFFDAYRAVKPYLMTTGNAPTRERIQSPTDRARYDDTTKCILCACCTTSCPVFWNEGSYFGPAAIVNAHRFIFDSRDEGAAERLEILNDKEGVWRCRTTFNCTEACPRGIEVTKAIAEVKQAVLRGRR
jgi:succinate dehydrogenase/fumarate reductase-like Fe-S protein